MVQAGQDNQGTPIVKTRTMSRAAIRRARQIIAIPPQYVASCLSRWYYKSLARHYRLSASAEYRLSRQHRANARYFRELAYCAARQLDQRRGA